MFGWADSMRERDEFQRLVENISVDYEVDSRGLHLFGLRQGTLSNAVESSSTIIVREFIDQLSDNEILDRCPVTWSELNRHQLEMILSRSNCRHFSFVQPSSSVTTWLVRVDEGVS